MTDYDQDWFESKEDSEKYKRFMRALTDSLLKGGWKLEEHDNGLFWVSDELKTAVSTSSLIDVGLHAYKHGIEDLDAFVNQFSTQISQYEVEEACTTCEDCEHEHSCATQIDIFKRFHAVFESLNMVEIFRDMSNAIRPHLGHFESEETKEIAEVFTYLTVSLALLNKKGLNREDILRAVSFLYDQQEAALSLPDIPPPNRTLH